MMAYYNEVERCSFRLLEAFCLGLGLERTALHHLFQARPAGLLHLCTNKPADCSGAQVAAAAGQPALLVAGYAPISGAAQAPPGSACSCALQ